MKANPIERMMTTKKVVRRDKVNVDPRKKINWRLKGK
jgi:hypothetical protein